MCPGKKEFVSIKINGKREHIQKRLLLLNLKELHVEFTKKYGQVIGLSKFCELCPKWCIPVGGASGLHSVCVCEYHQNLKLMCSKVPVIENYNDLLKKIVGKKNRDCMLKNCSKFPPVENLKNFLLENLTCYQWKKDEKYYNMSQMNSC